MSAKDVIPQALFPCAMDGCSDEVTYPADELRYWRGGSWEHGPCADDSKKWPWAEGFYCDNCIDQYGPPFCEMGDTLEKHL